MKLSIKDCVLYLFILYQKKAFQKLKNAFSFIQEC